MHCGVPSVGHETRVCAAAQDASPRHGCQIGYRQGRYTVHHTQKRAMSRNMISGVLLNSGSY